MTFARRRFSSRRVPHAILGIVFALAIAVPVSMGPVRSASLGLLTTPAELAQLPMSGPAWERVKAAADGSLGTPRLRDLGNEHDVRTLAVALVYGRTGIESYRAKAADAIMSAIGTEDGGLAAVVGRNLISYVLSADLIDFASFDPARDAQFRSWLSAVRTEVFSDGSLVGEDQTHANNHGRHAGASRLAASLYLGDQADVAQTVAIFKGFLGDRSSYNGFRWNQDLSWQADPNSPVGVNPAGSTRDGFSIDGALPEEMRRGCKFTVPPCPTAYPWGAFQSVFLAAEIMSRQGHDVWNWEDRALLRAVEFIHGLENAYGGWWATGDDIWQPWLINHAYGTSFPAVAVTRLGKNFGWSDWLWGQAGGGTPTQPMASFSANTTSGQAPLTVSFTDTSTGGPTNWSWTFGDGGTSAVRHPTHTYTEPGDYTVSLTASNSAGSNTATRTGYISVAPTGGGDDDIIVTPEADAYVRSDSPTSNAGSATTLRVRRTSTLSIDSYLKFTVSGIGSVGDAALRLYAGDGSTDGGAVHAVADDTWTESGITWSTRPATGTMVADIGAVTNGSWVELDVSSLVTGDGTYSIALTGAASDLASYHSRTGANPPQLVLTPGAGGVTAPIADFSATPRSGAAPLSVQFTDASLNGPTSWAWDFDGDGTIESAAQHPTFSYDAAGTYSVTLTAGNAAGSDSETKSAYITVGSGATVTTLTPTDDTYVDSGSPSAVNGAANNLRIRDTSRDLHTYLKFTVSGVGTPGTTTLRLWVLDASVDGGSLYLVPDSTWSEGTMSWSTREATSGTAVAAAGAVTAGTWAQFDVSTIVTGDGTYSFALISTSSDLARYASSEASASMRPQLVMTSD
jgi:PKD repeat protein